MKKYLFPVYLIAFIVIVLIVLFVKQSIANRDKELIIQIEKEDSLYRASKTATEYSNSTSFFSEQDLLSEIKRRDDVADAIISEAGGLCIAMYVDKNKAEYVIPHFLRMAKNKNAKIKFCKIVSALDYKVGRGYMNGTKLAFGNQK